MTDVLGTLELMKLPAGKWELLSNPIFLLNSGRTVKPSQGFIYDGGSVPQPFWSLGLTPVGTDADMAFLLHDWLYARSRLGYNDFSRKNADDAMLEVMLYFGVPDLIAYGAYAAVRGASQPYWGIHPKPAKDQGDYSWFWE